MSDSQWKRFSERPITLEDVGRFVVGRGYGRWAGGVITQTRQGLYIDTGYYGSPLRSYTDVDALRVYMFLDTPPNQDRP